MFTPTLCGPAYGTIQRKIVVKLRFYNDLLLFEGLFEDPREGFLKPISGERGIRTPETLLTFTRFPGVPLQPLEHLSLAWGIPVGLCEGCICLRPICIAESAAKVTLFFHRTGKKIPFFMGFFPFCRGGALLSPFRVAEKSDCGASLPNTANDDAQVPMPCWACGALYIMYASAYPFI